MTAVVSVPILLHSLLTGYLLASYGGRRWSYFRSQGFDDSQSAWLYVVMTAVILAILLSLSAQLAFLFGLLAKSQGRAITWLLGPFVAWCWIPLIGRTHGDASEWILYLSPISGLLANEFAEGGWWLHEAESGRWGFYLLIHCGLYATIAATLAWFNYRFARRVLLRPAGTPLAHCEVGPASLPRPIDSLARRDAWMNARPLAINRYFQRPPKV